MARNLAVLATSLLLSLFVLGGLAAPANAWGSAGHRTVCQIAYINLTAKARAEVDRLLQARPASLQSDPRNGQFSSACTYPDRPVTGGPPRRDEEHFVNYPRNLNAVSLQSGCGDAYECVDTAIIRDFAVLRSPFVPDDLKAIALIYLGHFVGDIHQPLHNSFADDRGGNSILAQGQCTSNLHSAWDTCILVRGAYANLAEPSDATIQSVSLFWSSTVTGIQRAQWLSSAPWQWSQESFAITTNVGTGYCIMVGATCQYDGTRVTFNGSNPRSVTIDAAYQARAMPIVQQRITEAGIRLAHLLNLALDPAYRFDLQ